VKWKGHKYSQWSKPYGLLPFKCAILTKKVQDYKWLVLSKNYIEIMRMIFILKIIEIIESFIIQETKIWKLKTNWYR
jgi:hypothetical protein